MPPVAVAAKHYSWRHASRKESVLTDITIDIATGERVLLTGDSGSGKSTLLAAIAGVQGGEDEGEQHGEILTKGIVGLVLQDPDSQVIASRVGDDVAFGCENLSVPRNEIWQRVDEALATVGLDLPLDFPTSKLSGGQKQRLALAGVLAMRPSVIALDEPTANLDPQGARDVVKAVTRAVEATGATLIVCEHNTALWEPVITRYLRLSGTVTELDGPPTMQRDAGITHRVLSTNQPPLLQADNIATVAGAVPDFSIPSGFSTVITGPNGAGKTSLALVLAGLDAPKRGQLHLSEQLADGLSTPPHRWRSAQLARRIGMVFQDPEHQFVARSVEEEMAIGAKVMGLDGLQHRIDDLLVRLRLDHLRRANPFSLSGGEKRRLSVATALVAAPRLLIFDEPTFGQDDATFVMLVTLIRELTQQGVSIISVTHDAEFMTALGDHRIEASAK